MDAKQYGGEYRVPLDGEPVSLDPVLLTDIYAINVASNLFDGLVEFDKKMHEQFFELVIQRLNQPLFVENIYNHEIRTIQ